MPPSGMPALAPLAMPEQRLDRFDRMGKRSLKLTSGKMVVRRWLVFGATGLMAAFAVSEMRGVLTVAGITWLEVLLLVLFAVNFTWIAFAFAGSLAGFARILRRTLSRKPPGKNFPKRRTAILMPTYNERPERVFAGIEAMALGIVGEGAGNLFDWFVLSDTTDPQIALQEERALSVIRERIGHVAPIYYRRRRRNIHRKAGNIADFCRRWGGAYDYLIVLDADSLMEPGTMLELARRMEADPDAGLIQTIPRLVNAGTLIARLQQFAGWVYGPVIGAGLADWTGAEGNFWGHNAIVRTIAFTGSAGLPVLPGSAPFGGHILSHDFVEAALLRRGGWAVRIADDLGGSFEESPPSLIDIARRDRRWCQGNLQHSKVISGAALSPISRIHLFTGIYSYIASPLWLLLILTGLALALEAHFIKPDYFPEGIPLFPTWPVIDSERALRLFAITMGVLFGPKFLGLFAFLLDRKSRRRGGGTLAITAGFLLESVLTALIAPIMMLVQSGIVYSILVGRDAGWTPQRRDDAELPWGDVFRFHRFHIAIGVLIAIGAYAVSPALLAWLSPAILGLLLAAPISRATGSARLGKWAVDRGLLRTPVENIRPAVFRRAEAARAVYAEYAAEPADLSQMVSDEEWRRSHLALMDEGEERRRGHVDPLEAVAAAKIEEAASLAEALAFLTAAEQALVIGTPILFKKLTALPSA